MRNVHRTENRDPKFLCSFGVDEVENIDEVKFAKTAEISYVKFMVVKPAEKVLKGRNACRNGFEFVT